MATIKEIAEMVGVSSAAVSRVLNYDEGISVSDQTRAAIFAAAEKVGYKKRVIYPKIENAGLLCFSEKGEELEDIFFGNFRDELLRQAKQMNIHMTVYTREDGIKAIPEDLSGFIAFGWLNREEINQLYDKCQNGVFIGTSPDEKLYDAVRANMDSFLTQMVDYLVSKGHQSIGFIGGTDRNIETLEPAMDIREWSFRSTVSYYQMLNEDYILISDQFTVEEGYRMGKKLLEKSTRPTALCVASDTLAVGVIQALTEHGISIPEQMAIYSINDAGIAKYTSPPLTTMHIDIPIMCATALELLQDRILSKRTITKSVFVNGIPVCRKSC